MLFITGDKEYAELASKKGIAITAVIAAAIVGSSFLIWLIPQSSPGIRIERISTDDTLISDIYSKHQMLAADVESKFGQWKDSEMTSSDVLGQINQDLSDILGMQHQLDNASPAQEWQESYDLYIRALNRFMEYLDTMQTIIENDRKLDSNSELDDLRQEWVNYVNSSINAMPI